MSSPQKAWISFIVFDLVLQQGKHNSVRAANCWGIQIFRFIFLWHQTCMSKEQIKLKDHTLYILKSKSKYMVLVCKLQTCFLFSVTEFLLGFKQKLF